MNIFIAIMLVFAAAGLLDEILGGKLGLMPNFEKGLATMGGLAMSTVGLFCDRSYICADPRGSDCRGGKAYAV